MKKFALLSAIALATAVVAAPAWSADTAAPPTDAAKSKVVCKNESVVGTRLTTRVCKTQAQLETEKQNAKEATTEFQRDGSQQMEKGS